MADYSLNEQFKYLVHTINNDQERKQNNNNNSKSVKSPDFFQDNNSIKKNKKNLKPYATSKIKTRNYISNISYAGVTKEDFFNRNFVFDIYVLLKKNLYPFSLDRKQSNQNKHEMTYMLWKKCIPADFYKFIWKEEHVLYLNRKNVLHLKIANIVRKFIDENGKNYRQLRNNLCQFKETFNMSTRLSILKFTAQQNVEVSIWKVPFI